MKSVLINFPDSSSKVIKAHSIEECFKQLPEHLANSEARFVFNGEDLRDLEWEDIPELAILEVELAVIGGKGGFGSLLRIAAAQKKHFNNFDSSRDANGRRLRDIKNELRLVEFIKRKRVEKKLLDEEMSNLNKQQQNKPTDPTAITRREVEDEYIEKLQKWQSGLNSTIRRGSVLRRTTKTRLKLDQIDTTQLPEPHDEGELLGKRAPLEKESSNRDHKNIKMITLPEKDNIPIEEYLQSNQKKLKASSHNEQSLLGPQLPVNTTNSQIFDEIDLMKVQNLQELEALHPDHLKYELKRLGLKCGGTPLDRAKRLWEIKLNPSNLFNPKFLTK